MDKHEDYKNSEDMFMCVPGSAAVYLLFLFITGFRFDMQGIRLLSDLIEMNIGKKHDQGWDRFINKMWRTYSFFFQLKEKIHKYFHNSSLINSF